MTTIIGDRPRVHYVKARYLRVGDLVARDDLSFGHITLVSHFPELETVTATFLDEQQWLGEDDTPIPVAADRGQATEWNLRRSQLDLEQLAELQQQAI